MGASLFHLLCSDVNAFSMSVSVAFNWFLLHMWVSITEYLHGYFPISPSLQWLQCFFHVCVTGVQLISWLGRQGWCEDKLVILTHKRCLLIFWYHRTERSLWCMIAQWFLNSRVVKSNSRWDTFSSPGLKKVAKSLLIDSKGTGCGEINCPHPTPVCCGLVQVLQYGTTPMLYWVWNPPPPNLRWRKEVSNCTKFYMHYTVGTV